MEFDELKERSKNKFLLRGASGSGKTYQAVRAALELSINDYNVAYVDTESEGSSTMVNLILSDDTEYEKEYVRNIEYYNVSGYEGLLEWCDHEDGLHERFDVVIIDTLDHKHTYALSRVTDDKKDTGADWNEYSMIYAAEKHMMEKLGKPEVDVIATLDPNSGKSDKPKGAQTNIEGYFSVVMDLDKDDNGWSYVIENYVGRSDLIGNAVQGMSPSDIAVREILQ